MDLRSIIRPIIVALVSIGLIVLVIVLIVQGFSGPAEPKRQVDVTKYTYRSAIATLLIDGPINLDQDHQQVRISVSNTINEIDIIHGYQNNVVATRTYANNTAGFASFLSALQLLGFSHGIDSKVDSRGFCPAGSRYTYSFSDGQTELFSYWSTSCGGQGTFRGDPAGVRNLFERQIPPRELQEVLRGVNVRM